MAIESKKTVSRISGAFDSSDQAIWIMSRDGSILEANRIFKKTLSALYGIEYKSGMSVGDIFSSDTQPLEYQFWMNHLAEAFKTDRYSLDYATAHKSLMEYYLINSFKIEPVDSGVSETIAVFSNNITKLKMAEESANEAYDFIRKVVDLSPVGILTFNTQGDCVSANLAASKIFGMSITQLLEVNYRTFNAWKDSGLRVLADDALSLRNEHATSLEIQGAKNRTMWAECRFLPFSLKGEAHVLFQITDDTERKQIEEDTRQIMRELRRSNEELEQYAYVVSHEISEPMRLIEQYLLESRQDKHGERKKDGRDSIQLALEASRKVQSMIEGLLSYSRIMASGESFAECAVDSVIKESISNLRVLIAESHAEIEYKAMPALAADYSQLVSLFQNLIGNAIKYCGASIPKIRIGCDEKDSEWFFYVIDNGIGIDPGQREHLFKLFGGGLRSSDGMGLAICQRIVDRHGGRIWVDSVAGNGSVFYFTIRKELDSK
jgi:PAS domain S-box-containing protein